MPGLPMPVARGGTRGEKLLTGIFYADVAAALVAMLLHLYLDYGLKLRQGLLAEAIEMALVLLVFLWVPLGFALWEFRALESLQAKHGPRVAHALYQAGRLAFPAMAAAMVVSGMVGYVEESRVICRGWRPAISPIWLPITFSASGLLAFVLFAVSRLRRQAPHSRRVSRSAGALARSV